ncbi:pyridoxal phosphate-dependent aminotransferase [Irregularibacter muris]|uniref:cysteine-S-conjugate beta-lyase n=1 Tax=Irregularibacter muris TaxID=1796619 RepID=A0AAE3HGH3_9FIRM|nr:MalY/PatB family protein [Irregularibacter muris]MCR1900220.1 pyridoxal phosphate-dependent aminotransferase [Irregularibacter muris]
MHNFNEVINRKGTSSVKYEEMDLKFGKKELIPFWVADMDIKSPDFIISSINKRAEHGVFGYTKRMPEYYEAIINWLDNRHNLKAKRENIEYAPGVVFLLNMMVRKFTNEGDKIIIQPPVYYPFFNVIEGNNRIVVENNLILDNGKYIMDFEDLKNKAKDPACKMLILCSPHNPVGRVWTREELEELGKICIENNVFVIADEIHYDLVYKPNKHIPFASISEEFKMNSIICTAPSKTFNIAGLHSAFCIIYDQEKMDIYRNELGLLDLNRSNVFSREVTQVAYENGAKWVDELLDFLKGNMEFVYDYISKNIKGITPFKLEGTYLMWLDCRGLGLDKESIDDLFINEAGLALDSGYWFGEVGRGFMRINIACPRSMLKEALEKLENIIN